MKVTAVVPAAGRGCRLKENIDKPFVTLGDKPILIRTLKALSECALIDEIIVAISKDNFGLLHRELLKERLDNGFIRIVKGGSTRGQSVYQGLNKVDRDTDLVLIHDGVRPFVTQEIVCGAIKKALKFGAAVAAVPVRSTIKKVRSGKVGIRNKKGELIVGSTLNRDSLWEIQTPQVFRRELILRAYEKAMRNGFKATDDSCLVERLGHKVSIVPGSYSNIKITTPEDLIFAEALLKRDADLRGL